MLRFSSFETETSVVVPFWIPKPPPRAPTLSKSKIGVPFGVLSQISKKLEIPDGLKALAVFNQTYSSRLVFKEGKAL
jgi:hypothetical protein